jgi:hypothetical protein
LASSADQDFERVASTLPWLEVAASDEAAPVASSLNESLVDFPVFASK